MIRIPSQLFAAKFLLDEIGGGIIERDGRKIKIKGYTANTMEDCIVAAVKAEKEGARGIICGTNSCYVNRENSGYSCCNNKTECILLSGSNRDVKKQDRIKKLKGLPDKSDKTLSVLY